jgi:flagellin-like protein
VSPVIATILMVAITVVLAAVLYVMVTGLLGGGTQTTPQVTFSPPVAQGSGIWKSAVAGVSQSSALSAYQVQVLNGTATSIGATDVSTVKAAGATGVSGGGLTLKFTDIGGSGADKLTGGDFFTLSGTSGSSTYQILLIWKASGDVVSTISIG